MIVDDEYVVRKGLMHIVPWRHYDIELVGEASNGQKALEQLAERPVDLLVTDLTMPIMDGFQLIRQVKRQHPSTRTVVLTCHQDFHLVQEALRLGAIDYIVKTELENDKLVKSIERIVERLREEAGRPGPGGGEGTEGVPAQVAPWALFLVPVDRNAEAAPPVVLAAEGASDRIVGIEGGGWCIRSADLRDNCRTPKSACGVLDLERWVPVIVRDVPNMKEKRLIHLLGVYREERLFYDYRDKQSVYELSWSELETPVKADSGAAEGLRHRLKALYWVYDDREFAALCEQAAAVRPFAPSWTLLLRDILYAWRQFTSIPEAAEWSAKDERLL
jgi:two-component system response regulator YesN